MRAIYAARYSVYSGWGWSARDAFSQLAAQTPTRPLPEEITLNTYYIGNPEIEVIHVNPQKSGLISPIINGRVKSFDEIAGLDRMGQGNFSTVYALTDKVVMKVTNRENDHGYRAYADYCSRKTSNPYLPRIYYRTKVRDQDVYILERLEKVRDYSPTHRFADELQTLFGFARDGYIRFPDEKLHELVEEFGAENMGDLTARNCMMRGDQLVITDPCANVYSKGKPYLPETIRKRAARRHFTGQGIKLLGLDPTFPKG